jgi:hypothetical protein
MKNYKKIGLGISFSLLLLVGLGPRAFAAGGPINGTGEWNQATYTMNQKSQIIVNLSGNDHDNINFNGSSPTYNADTNGTGVCSGTITFSSGQSLTSHPIKANISVKFMNSQGPTPSCANGGNGSYSGSISIANNTSNNGGTSADTGPKAITFNGATYPQVNTGAGTRA